MYINLAKETVFSRVYDINYKIFPKIEGFLFHQRPKYIYAELPGDISNEKRSKAFLEFLQQISSFGYDAAWRDLDYRVFGIPYKRKRTIFIANLRGLPSSADILFESRKGFPNSIQCSNEEKASASAFARMLTKDCVKTKNFNNLLAVCYNEEKTKVVPHNLLHFKKKVKIPDDYQIFLRTFTNIEIERMFFYPDNYTLFDYYPGMIQISGSNSTELFRLRRDAVVYSKLIPSVRYFTKLIVDRL